METHKTIIPANFIVVGKMKKRGKIILSLLVLSLAIFVGVNVPIIPSGSWQECDYTLTNYHCFTRTAYDSYLFQLYGWNDPFWPGCCDNSVSTVTLPSATLHSGNVANASTEATASLSFSLDNPGSKTQIVSLVLSGNGVNVTSWDNSTQPSTTSNRIVFVSSHQGDDILSSGAVTSFTYYPEDNGSSDEITHAQTYNYVINFQNGQSVSGALMAQ